MVKRIGFVLLILWWSLSTGASAQVRRKTCGQPCSYPAGARALPNESDFLKMLALSGARLAENPPSFTCSSLAARAEGFSTSIALDFGPVPKGFRDLDGVEVDGNAALQSALHELFLEGTGFSISHRTTLNKRRVVVARHIENDRQAMVYVDTKTGAIAGLRLRGYPTNQPVTALQCWTD